MLKDLHLIWFARASFAGACLCLTPVPGGAAAPNPAALFAEVCLKGGASIPRDRLKTTRASRVRWEPMELLRMAQRDHEMRPVFKRYYFDAKRDYPNTFYKVSGSPEAYLMLPVSAELKPGTTASQCAVVWQGKDFMAAQDAVAPWMVAPEKRFERASGVTGLGWVDFYHGGSAITAATYNGWTMLRSRPKLPASAE